MFVIFISDFQELIEDYCKLYAGDRKIIRVIEDESSVESLQIVIDTSWTKEWLRSSSQANAR